MLMSMGHIEVHTADPLNQNLRLTGVAAVAVAVARHLVKTKTGIFLPHGFSVVKMISKMNHRIRLHGIDAAAHKTEGGMGIG